MQMHWNVFNKTLNTSSLLQSFPDCYKTQEMYVKAVDTSPFYLIIFLVDISLNKCVSKTVFSDSFILKFCSDR